MSIVNKSCFKSVIFLLTHISSKCEESISIPSTLDAPTFTKFTQFAPFLVPISKQLLLLKAIQIQEFAVYTRCLNTYKGHFGLSLDYYTHFTSPVRRFADIMVHEQLEKCINNQQLKNHEIIQL